MNDYKTEEILLQAGIISDEQLRAVKSIQANTGESLEAILLSQGTLNCKEFLAVKAKRVGVEFIDLENIKVNKNAVLMLDPEISKKYIVFPFDIRDNHLYLAMENPDDIFLIDEIKVFINMEIKPYLADIKLIKNAIDYFYSEDIRGECAASIEEQMFNIFDRESCDEFPAYPKKLKGSLSDTMYKFADLTSEAIKKLLEAGKIEDSITGIDIDTVNRKLKVTLTLKY